MSMEIFEHKTRRYILATHSGANKARRIHGWETRIRPYLESSALSSTEKRLNEFIELLTLGSVPPPGLKGGVVGVRGRNPDIKMMKKVWVQSFSHSILKRKGQFQCEY